MQLNGRSGWDGDLARLSCKSGRFNYTMVNGRIFSSGNFCGRMSYRHSVQRNDSFLLGASTLSTFPDFCQCQTDCAIRLLAVKSSSICAHHNFTWLGNFLPWSNRLQRQTNRARGVHSTGLCSVNRWAQESQPRWLGNIRLN